MSRNPFDRLGAKQPSATGAKPQDRFNFTDLRRTHRGGGGRPQPVAKNVRWCGQKRVR
jgi:hypothetical protein